MPASNMLASGGGPASGHSGRPASPTPPPASWLVAASVLLPPWSISWLQPVEQPDAPPARSAASARTASGRTARMIARGDRATPVPGQAREIAAPPESAGGTQWHSASLDVVVGQAAVEGAPRHAERLGRPGAVPAVRLERVQDAALLAGAAFVGRARAGGAAAARTRAGERLEVGDVDDLALGEHRDLGERVLELAHVARPRHVSHGAQCPAGDAARGQPGALGDGGQEVLDQERDVLAAVAQGRQLD